MLSWRIVMICNRLLWLPRCRILKTPTITRILLKGNPQQRMITRLKSISFLKPSKPSRERTLNKRWCTLLSPSGPWCQQIPLIDQTRAERKVGTRLQPLNGFGPSKPKESFKISLPEAIMAPECHEGPLATGLWWAVSLIFLSIKTLP